MSDKLPPSGTSTSRKKVTQRKAAPAKAPPAAAKAAPPKPPPQPPLPNGTAIRQILRDSKNGRGDMYDPTWTYKLATQARTQEKVTQGFRVLVEDIQGSHGEVFTLLGRPPEAS